MDVKGYLELFGRPFWQDEHNPTVHAFVAGVSDNGTNKQIQVEVVSAASFDAEFERYREDPVSLFAGLNTAPAILDLDEAGARKLFEINDDVPLEGSWRTFTLDSSSRLENQINLLQTLADPEGSVFGIKGSKATPSHVVAVHAKSPGTIANERDIQDSLEKLPKSLELAVLDVGQGNASFLFAGRFFPLVYFDLGGGVAKNAKSFPVPGVHWCFTKKPPVILSHWHWDHWAGATYGSVTNVKEALKADWLVPDQKTGSHTNKFKAKIINGGGTILLWPAGLGPMTVGSVTIGRATGSDLNDSGLVLLIESPPGRFSLLPGDAEYDRIPSEITMRYPQGLKTLVISHHCGKLYGAPPYKIPSPDGIDGNVALCSVGVANTYGHPTVANMAEHANAGWKNIVQTDARLGLPVRHLVADTGGALGGKLHPACGGSGSGACSLILHT